MVSLILSLKSYLSLVLRSYRSVILGIFNLGNKLLYSLGLSNLSSTLFLLKTLNFSSSYSLGEEISVLLRPTNIFLVFIEIVFFAIGLNGGFSKGCEFNIYFSLFNDGLCLDQMNFIKRFTCNEPT